MGRIVDISEVLLELGLSGSVTEEERSVVDSALTRAEGAVKRFLAYDPVYTADRVEYYPQQDFDYSSRAALWEVEGGQAVLRRMASAATTELYIRHVPVRSVAELHVDYDGRSGARAGAFGAESLKTEGIDYWPNYDLEDSTGNKVCRDGIIRTVGDWPTTPGTVRIRYAAGYTREELHGQDAVLDASPIASAVTEEACRRARRALLVHRKKTGSGFAGPFKSEKLGDYGYTMDDVGNKELMGTGDLLARTMDALEDYVNWAYRIGG